MAAVVCARFTRSGSIRRGLAIHEHCHSSSHLDSELELDLESQLTLLSSGLLQARASGGELFSPFLPAAMEPASDDEARRLFALLKELDEETNVRKAPVIQVFRLYCLEGLSRAVVAKRCGCVESLVTLRLKAIHKKLGRKPAELRQLSPQFERMEDSLSDSRAKHIHRQSAIDDGRFDDND